MSNHNTTSTASTRRAFLGTTAAALTASTLLSSAGCSNTMKRLSGSARSPLIGKGDVILFQGDSITDAGRNRAREDNANDRSALGGGYAFLIAAQLLPLSSSFRSFVLGHTADTAGEYRVLFDTEAEVGRAVYFRVDNVKWETAPSSAVGPASVGRVKALYH